LEVPRLFLAHLPHSRGALFPTTCPYEQGRVDHRGYRDSVSVVFGWAEGYAVPERCAVGGLRVGSLLA